MTDHDPGSFQPEPSRLEGKLEPEARDCQSVQEAALLSLAVSMKRIADTMDGSATGICITETLIGGRAHGR